MVSGFDSFFPHFYAQKYLCLASGSHTSIPIHRINIELTVRTGHQEQNLLSRSKDAVDGGDVNM